MNLKQLLRHHRIKIYGAIAILGLGSITLYHMPREENVSAPKTIETEEPAIPEKQNVAPELVLDSSVKTLTEEQKILLQQNISLSNNQYLNQKIRNYRLIILIVNTLESIKRYKLIIAFQSMFLNMEQML